MPRKAGNKGRQKLRELFVGILVFLIVSILLFLAFEVFLRIFVPQNTEESIFNPYYHWQNIPGYESDFRSLAPGEYKTHIKINSKGLRDFEYSYERNSKKRILVLGDSFAYGHGVEQNQSFPKLLEQKLGPGYEVINGGHKGFSTEEEILFYRYELKKYNPDIVLVAFFIGNDVNTNVLVNVTKNGSSLSIIDHAPYPAPPFQMRVRLWLARNSYAYNFFIKAAVLTPFIKSGLIRLGIFAPEWAPLYSLPEQEYKAMMDDTTLLLKAFHQELQRENRTMILAVLPEYSQVYDDVYRANLVRFNITNPLPINEGNKRMREFCSDESITCIDLLSSFRAKNNEALFYKVDQHFTPAGHVIVADELYGRLK